MILALAAVSAVQVAEASSFGVMLSRLVTALLIVGVGLVYYVILNAKIRFRDVWVGAVLTGVLCESFSRSSRGTSAAPPG